METNPTRTHEVALPGLTQWVKDLALLWLRCRSAAVAPIRPLALESPYAKGSALKKQKKTKQNKQKKTLENSLPDEGKTRYVKNKLPDFMEFKINVTKKIFLKTNKKTLLEM